MTIGASLVSIGEASPPLGRLVSPAAATALPEARGCSQEALAAPLSSAHAGSDGQPGSLWRTTATSRPMGTGARIILEREGDLWVAEDTETGIASQGETREEALANLDEAIELTEQAQAADTPAPEPDAPWFKSG